MPIIVLMVFRQFMKAHIVKIYRLAGEKVKPAEGKIMDNYYITNMETNKLELHFDKATYQALTDAEKSEIKSNFLFSRAGSCWVSRCKFPSLSRAERVAQSIGLENAGKIGTHSFEAEMEAKQARAEARAERYEGYSDNATARGNALQKPIEEMHGDIAFFTQPNINSSAGRAFTNRRNRMWASWERGFEEFKKSEYFQEKAEAARRTAAGCKMQDVAFCERRIKEATHDINAQKKNIERYEKYIERLNNGEKLKKRYSEEEITREDVESWLERSNEIVDQAADKIAYYEGMIEAQGGRKFSANDIKPGDVVLAGGRQLTVVSKGTVNFVGRSSTGFSLTYQISEITEILGHADENAILHPFKVGEVFTVGQRYNKEIKVEIVKVLQTKVSIRINDGKAKSLTVRQGYNRNEYYIPVSVNSWDCEWITKRAE